MKNTAILLVLSALLSTACTTPATVPPSQLQTEVAAAIAATNASHSPTPAATNTPAATSTPRPTNTPAPTNTPRPSNTPRPTPTPNYGSIKNPYPFKAEIGLSLTRAGNKAQFYFQVVEVIRGAEANNAVRQANTFNDEPPAGMEYALIRVKVTLISGTLRFREGDLAIVSNGQIFGQFSSSVCCMKDANYPEIKANLALPAASTDGWIVRPVFIDDTRPLLAIGLSYYKTIEDGIFFSLTP